MWCVAICKQITTKPCLANKMYHFPDCGYNTEFAIFLVTVQANLGNLEILPHDANLLNLQNSEFIKKPLIYKSYKNKEYFIIDALYGACP